MTETITLEPGWKSVLEEEFSKAYMESLKQFLILEQERFEIFPRNKEIFSAFDRTPFHQVRVVILGQDPYHQPGQAHGLSFSVPESVRIPPSLRNIYKELASDISGFVIPNHGNLDQWAAQGVLLLNATLTVRANQAGSHQNKGWETFTDEAIHQVSERHSGIVFMLWGRYAQQKAKLIDPNEHLILKAAHPSPLSAYQGFLGSGHFSKANLFLQSQGLEPIHWQV